MGRGVDMWSMSKGVLIGKEGREITVGEVLILKEKEGKSKKGLGTNVEGRIGILVGTTHLRKGKLWRN
ncbi:hypothetical protein IEQ34_018343 [Dendrobium chrysotoxum]|uniref:Uncharacterized protein n=1 Tax=Dendrobium chrysotoxum TaxID=161865 RepID=A0AAV7FWN9_DENCH|nr:hypothetical protein IEQ34_018343 [Dendrobium chrysotoxum]